MSRQNPSRKVCVVIGASHAGVNFSFNLRREGWGGEILLYDKDPLLPYQKPPLSKAFISGFNNIEEYVFKPSESYHQEGISLNTGIEVRAINTQKKFITLEDQSVQRYDKLVIASGASPRIPLIKGIDAATNLFTIRNAEDSLKIRDAIRASKLKRVLIIGGGYIGLESAASLTKLGAQVTVLEREKRLLSRVCAPQLADFIQELHQRNGVAIYTNKHIKAINTNGFSNEVVCDDKTTFKADLIIVGTGIKINTELAELAGLEVKDGIVIDERTQTSDKDIYAIGDCTYHYNLHYNCFIRLESVQNAHDQAKVAAANICGKDIFYDSIPWFWSDQFDMKLQMAGLSKGYDQVLMRFEKDQKTSLSAWYFKNNSLIAVDTINHPKAYVLGTKFIKNGQKLDLGKLQDPLTEFKPNNLIKI